MNSNASEVAQVIAKLVPALPEETARDLRRLLGHSLAAPKSGAVRQARIGLLVEMVSDLSGEIPTCERYEEERAVRMSQGQDWPAHTTLIRAYGHWIAAVKAAMRHAKRGTPERVPSSLHHARFRKSYRPADVIEAIRACRASLSGAWPTQWEYEEWAALRRRLSRAAGLPEPRLPGLPQIRKLFGNWDQALTAAMSRHGQREDA